MNESYLSYLSQQVTNISSSLSFLLPEYLLVGGILLLIITSILPQINSFHQACIAFSLLLIASICLFLQIHQSSISLFSGMLELDRFSFLIKVIIFISSLLVIPFVHIYEKPAKEWYVLFMAIVVSGFFMSMANHLIVMLISMEMLSLSSYLMAGLRKESRTNTEAAIKYMLFGLFSSACMIYGLSWWYGLTGGFTFLPNSLEGISLGVSIFTFSLILLGFLFKIGAVPFHFWQPDVFDGLTYPTVSFFATVPKIAAFAMLTRFLLHFYDISAQIIWFQSLIGFVAILSMTIGNLLAINQVNTKRMLAYSSIAHTGFLLLPLITLQNKGSLGVLLFYLLIYSLSNFAAFLIAGVLHHSTSSDKMTELSGQANKAPFWAVSFIVVLVSLIGLPPTAGFIGKLFVFTYLIKDWQQTNHIFYLILSVAAVLNTVLSLFYYLKIPSLMIFKKSETSLSIPNTLSYPTLIIGVLSLLIVLLGIYGFDSVLNFLDKT